MKTEIETISKAFELMQFVWDNVKTDTWDRINTTMRKALDLAIVSGIEFNKDDFGNIYSSFNGGYWLYTNLNGNGMGECFYENAVEDNISFCQSYERFYGIKPFLDSKGKRLHIYARYYDEKRRYRVTGFNFDDKRVNFVSYEKMDIKEVGRKRLFSFTNKEWNEFRKKLTRL